MCTASPCYVLRVRVVEVLLASREDTQSPPWLSLIHHPPLCTVQAGGLSGNEFVTTRQCQVAQALVRLILGP